MALKEIAVDGCTLTHKAGSLISGGVFTITSIPSIKVKADNKGVFETPLTYTFSGGNATGYIPGTIATTAPQSITSSAIKVKADGQLVMLINDFGTMSAFGTLNPPPPGGTPNTPIAGLVEISDAGQAKVKGS